MATRVIRLAGVLFAGLLSLPVWAQPDINRFNERTVEKKSSPQDREGIWMLDFHFKDPRVITVDIPGKGRKLVWYLWYQVSNGTDQPRTYVPDFVWVCHDENTVHHDQIIPSAQRAIRKVEDPTNLLDLKNSSTISNEPIPVSKEFDKDLQRIAFPKLVTGVATWDDINPKSTHFSIYVYGLSDGWAVVDGPDGKPIVRRKTLQLKFKRLGDEFNHNSGQIRYLGHDWIYATQDLPSPDEDAAKAKKPAEEKTPDDKKPQEKKPEEKKPAPAPGQPPARE
jgi:hypothetical protein